MTHFETGKIFSGNETVSAESVAWTEHAKFKGVFLKHLVTGAKTAGKISCHLVRIEPGCAIGDHVHGKELEIHEVLEGKGEFELDGKLYPYKPGAVGIIPENTSHQVRAGTDGLLILAKFSPALL